MPSTAESAREALSQRCQAVIDADIAYLDKILTPTFRHIHGSGKVEPRADYLASIAERKGEFLVIDPRDLTIDAWENGAIVSGDIFIERSVDGQKIGNTSRFSSVWRGDSGQWQLAYWQMTGIK